ncbi:unnamed protein product [Microthlaspi erraticum]|uniref:BAHD acyltransferase n=1 Tax=Microthlaspi erraticum TaxID=1685480 RepID=A0A6D2J070_9BRAS|nr:unnamed protein product [Microthlaspi erraticum]
MANNLIKISRVGPATNLVDPLILPLTFFDLVWLTDIPTNRVNFYKLTESSSDSFYSVILPKLEQSLSLVLTHFPPLSGHVKWDQQDPKPHIVVFPQDVSLSQWPSPTLTSLMFPAKGFQGFCIGATINHACYGRQNCGEVSQTWAHICKYGTTPQDIDLPMLLDRTVINIPAELEWKFFKLQPYLSQDKANARGDEGDRLVPFTFVADFRDRLDPPVPVNYYGNCVVPISFSGDKAKMFSGEDGFVNAVKILSDSVNGLNSRGAESIWELYEEGLKKMELGSTQKLSVSGSNKFGIYGSDFGWGRPVSTENISISHNVLFSMSERRDEIGGVEIGMCLKKCVMDSFISAFQNGL